MRRLIVLLLLSVPLFGCKYTVPLLDSANRPLEEAMLGNWRQSGGGNEDKQALVLAFSNSEYLIAYRVNDRSLYFRGYPIRFEGNDYVQLQLIGSGDGPIAGRDRRYDVLRYRLNGGRLSVWLLNSRVIARDIAGQDAFRRAFRRQSGNNPDLFQKLGEFHKLDQAGS